MARSVCQIVGFMSLAFFVLDSECFLFGPKDDICAYCSPDYGEPFCPALHYDPVTNTTSWCYCDDLCSYYRDCCPKSSQIPEQREISQKERDLFGKLECRDVDHHTLTNISLQMIASCPNAWPDNYTRSRCENEDPESIAEEINVVATLESDVDFLFKNYYCAFCNSLPDSKALNFEILSPRACDLYTFRENLRKLSFHAALEIMLQGDCTYYLSTYGMENGETIKRRCDSNMDPGFTFEEGLGSLFNFIPNPTPTDAVQKGQLVEITCLADQYRIGDTCHNFQLSPHQKMINFQFEYGGPLTLEDAEVYADAFLEFVEISYRMKSTYPPPFEYQSLIVSWAVTLEDGVHDVSKLPCTRIQLDALLEDINVAADFSYDMLEYLCLKDKCDFERPLQRPTKETKCSIKHKSGEQRVMLEPTITLSLLDVLSISSSAVSVLSLTITLFVCIRCPFYHNLPGRLSLSLVGNLLLAHILFLSGHPLQRSTVECMVLGVLLHWSWLTTFVWMSVCSFHTWFAFSHFGFTYLKYNNDRHLAFLLYNLIGYGLPLVITGVGIALFFLCQTCDVGYGKNSCFISNSTMLLALFAAPVGILLTMNSVFFVLTVRGIQNLPKMRTDELSLNRNNLKIYVKLSLLIGMTFILSFVAEIANVKWLLYISNVVNGTQGFHLFLSYVCNPRTLRFLRSSFTESTSSSAADPSTKQQTTKF